MTHISAHLGHGSNAENQQHQLLHCHTIVQCILNADIRKGVWPNADRGRGRITGHFLQTSFMDHP